MSKTKPERTNKAADIEIPKGRMIAGAFFFVFGFLCPVFIPFVYKLDLPVVWQTALAGFLALGIPELFMLIAVAILGKQGFEYLKNKLAGWLKPLAPPDRVSSTRYRIGLFLFSIPLLLGWLLPYFTNLINWYDQYDLWIHAGADILLIISLFVLGGNFWDKLRGLFIWEGKISINKN